MGRLSSNALLSCLIARSSFYENFSKEDTNIWGLVTCMYIGDMSVFCYMSHVDYYNSVSGRSPVGLSPHARVAAGSHTQPTAGNTGRWLFLDQ